MECVWALPLWDWRDRQGCVRLCSVHAIRTFTVYDQPPPPNRNIRFVKSEGIINMFTKPKT
eukprot:7355722-Prymnesium_polylepis.1